MNFPEYPAFLCPFHVCPFPISVRSVHFEHDSVSVTALGIEAMRRAKLWRVERVGALTICKGYADDTGFVERALSMEQRWNGNCGPETKKTSWLGAFRGSPNVLWMRGAVCRMGPENGRCGGIVTIDLMLIFVVEIC